MADAPWDTGTGPTFVLIRSGGFIDVPRASCYRMVRFRSLPSNSGVPTPSGNGGLACPGGADILMGGAVSCESR